VRRLGVRVRGTALRASIVIAAMAVGGCDEKKDASVSVDASTLADAGARARLDSSTGTQGADAGMGTQGGDAGTGMQKVICKVMASEGGPSLHANAMEWLDVGAKASFTVRTLESGRELRFEGPGRVRACGDDVALVAEGSAIGLPGSGEAPGAEQWVATACGVARWASGVHRFTGGKNNCRLQLSLGSAHLYVTEDVVMEDLPFDGGAPDAGVALSADAGGATGTWQRFESKRSIGLHARGSLGSLDSPAAVKSALSACERAATNVQTLATKMRDGGGASNIGALAADSVVARSETRAACAVAAVRVAMAGSKPDDQKRLDAANARWTSPR
jgi:hypothetical protein